MVVFGEVPRVAPGQAAPVLGEGIRHLSLVPPIEEESTIDGVARPKAIRSLNQTANFHFAEMERLEGQHPQDPIEAGAVGLMKVLEQRQAEMLISRALNMGIEVDLI